MLRIGIPIIAVCGLAACSPGANNAANTDGASVELNVNALVLPDATDILYDITVTNGASAAVWSETAVSSNLYGAVDGSGSFAYVGPCDADSPSHIATLTVNDLSGLAADEWVNPGPLQKAFTCVEDQSTAIVFDVVIAQDGEQGFSDIAVDFDDIYCSAAVDCHAGSIQDASGSRIPTAILSMTCTAGDDPITGATPDTVLYMDDLVIDCGGDGDATIDPAPDADGLNVTPNGAVTSHLVLRNNLNDLDEQTTFWQISLGMDTSKTCTLTTSMTASNGRLDALTTPENNSWPVIDVDVDLTDGNGSTLACTTHGMTATENVGDVHVSYVGDLDVDGAFPGQTFTNIYDFGYVPPWLGIAGNLDASCAYNADGDLSCWGAAAGTGTVSGSAGITDVIGVAGGFLHMCAMHSDGTVSCWGDNTFGGLDNHGTITDATTIAAGGTQVCAIDSNTDVTCTGSALYGVDTGASGRTGRTHIAVGIAVACDLDASGNLGCWGTDPGSTALSSAPTVTGAKDLCMASGHGCVVESDDTVQCWGDNGLGQAPADPGVTGATAVGCAETHSCALLSDGTVTCWGSDSDGGVSGASAVSGGSILVGGDEHSCAIDDTNAISCWGKDSDGQASGSP